MSKHTPGPWSVPEQYCSEIERADGKTIASCWHEKCVDVEVKLVGVADVSLEESKANARLIAAAPDLLEVAKRALRYIPTDCVQCRGDKCRERWCISCYGDDTAEAAIAEAKADIDAIRAAIAKAEGGAA